MWLHAFMTRRIDGGEWLKQCKRLFQVLLTWLPVHGNLTVVLSRCKPSQLKSVNCSPSVHFSYTSLDTRNIYCRFSSYRYDKFQITFTSAFSSLLYLPPPSQNTLRKTGLTALLRPKSQRYVPSNEVRYIPGNGIRPPAIIAQTH